MYPLNRNDEVPVTDINPPTPSREQRVYRAVVAHAVPYVFYIALIGLGFGVLSGVIASLISVGTLELPTIAIYAMLGTLIGVAIAVQPVLRALLAFRWAADEPPR